MAVYSRRSVVVRSGAASAYGYRRRYLRRRFVSARRSLRYRIRRPYLSRRYPTITYPGASREVKYHDCARGQVLLVTTPPDPVFSQGRYYVMDSAPINTIGNMRFNGISTGSLPNQRVGNKIQSLFISVKMSFTGLISGTESATPSEFVAENIVFKRTQFRYVVVEDKTMPISSDGPVNYRTLYDYVGAATIGQSDDINPLMADRNISAIGRYNVLKQGYVICDSDDPTKIVTFRLPFRRAMRYDGATADASATNNVYVVVVAWTPFIENPAPVRTQPRVDVFGRMGFTDM